LVKQLASWTRGEVLQVTCTEHVDSVLQKEKERLVVIQCTFSWCRPCKGFKPKYVRLAVEYPQVAFLSLVANENEETKEVYERLQTFTSGAMFGTPAHVLIRHGKLVAVCCTTTESKLKQILDEHLEPPTAIRPTIVTGPKARTDVGQLR
jgi:thiol-disulfide isomerase/thioredoxin